MRPVRLTGVTGTSQAVPLDTYSKAQASAYLSSAGAPTLEITLDDPFTASPAPVWFAPAAAAANAISTLAPGVRAVRGVGMVAADVLRVSQQGF